MSTVKRIICADWGKEPKKRSAYEVILADRVVRRVATDVREVGRLLQYALDEPTLLAFDAPLGVPASFISAVRRTPGRAGVEGFMSWVMTASLDECMDANDWCVDAPFFQVPAGKGARSKFEAAARSQGVELRRRIELQTGGNPVFVTAGVPGSVGSAARDIWRGLVVARRTGMPFRVWPFEGDRDARLAIEGPIVAEIYPRAAYATALVDEAPRARMRIAKTDKKGALKSERNVVRSRAMERLLNTRWQRTASVRFEDTEVAVNNEDDFDSLMTCAALIRCFIEDLPLHSPELHESAMEGGILGTGSIDFALAEKTFK